MIYFRRRALTEDALEPASDFPSSRIDNGRSLTVEPMLTETIDAQPTTVDMDMEVYFTAGNNKRAFNKLSSSLPTSVCFGHREHFSGSMANIPAFSFESVCGPLQQAAACCAISLFCFSTQSKLSKLKFHSRVPMCHPKASVMILIYFKVVVR